MKHSTNSKIPRTEKGSKMTDFIRKPIVQMVKDLGITGILLFVLIGNYRQTDKYMTMYESQSKESTAAQVELAKALAGLKEAVNRK